MHSAIYRGTRLCRALEDDYPAIEQHAKAEGGTRKKLSMIATVTNQGKARWMMIDAAFDADKRIESLQSLIQGVGKRVPRTQNKWSAVHGSAKRSWCRGAEINQQPSFE